MTRALSASPSRIWIIGPSGSGKSTLARQLATLLQLPHRELDACLWGPGWARRSEEEFLASVATIASGEQWVLDGHYRAAHDLLTERAEVVVWLDFPRWVTLPRIARRSLSDLVSRRELYNGNTQSMRGVVELLSWATSADAEIRSVNSRLHLRIAPTVAFYALRSSRDVEQFKAEVRRVATSRGEG